MIRYRAHCIFSVVATFWALLIATPAAVADTSYVGESELVSWSCTGNPCPWGDWLDGQALVWPAALNPDNERFGYTTSGGVYLPAEVANRVTVWIDSGSATLYAGYPDGDSHRVLATLSNSYYFDVSGLAPGEVLSVQSGASFGYQIDVRSEPVPEVPPVGIPSQLVTWACTGFDCPWGDSVTGHALVWPEFAEATSSRFGYTTSEAVYLPSTRANGTAVRLEHGYATVYAGAPDASSHRVLATIAPGSTYVISGVQADEVVSVQADQEFRYEVDVAEPSGPEEPDEPAPPGGGGGSGSSATSTWVTWTCTSSPCPWGDVLSGEAQVWPTEDALDTRLGYTTSEKVYLPASLANGTKLLLNSGSASVYAGPPGAESHRLVATLVVGVEYEVFGLLNDEVLSVQNDSPFDVTVALSNGPPTGNPGGGGSPSATSTLVTWTCTSSPCPWGQVLWGEAQVWPTEDALDTRLGYTTSEKVYLPASLANGTKLLLNSGAASVYAGPLGAESHRLVATLVVGVEYEVWGLLNNEVLSVQNDSPFDVTVVLSDGQSPEDPEDPPIPPELPPGAMHSIKAYWRCDIPECSGPDWLGSVIEWPSWAAYPNNARSGDMSRTVYAEDGRILYPYMGPWAHGCEVTAHAGTVLIIEWERGTDEWRETYIQPGETHVIQLASPEDGAMIEINGHFIDFVVTVDNCTPQPLP